MAGLGTAALPDVGHGMTGILAALFGLVMIALVAFCVIGTQKHYPAAELTRAAPGG